MRVQVGDVKLFFESEGLQWAPDGAAMQERPTLILLHGGPGLDHSWFKPLFSRLSGGGDCHLIYLDQRGCGRSDRGNPRYWCLDQWADDVRMFCQTLEIERPVVLGVSFGGQVAMRYALRHPGHARGLVLMTTSACFHPERAIQAFAQLSGQDAAQAASAFFNDPSERTLPRYAERCLPLYTRSSFDPHRVARSILNNEVLFRFFAGELRSLNELPNLSRVQCPTLVIGGDQDPITPIADSLELAAALPLQLVQLERFAKCGHFAYYDDPERVLQVVQGFLGRVQP